MINLVLDTNILHQEGIDSGRMKVLRTLIDSGIVKLYIPEIVKREFCTKRISSIRELLDKALNNFKSAHKKIETECKIKAALTSIEAETRGVLESVELGVNEEFSNWEKSFGVEILPFVPEDISIVLDDYFNGSGAFKSIKNRDDIPDSMIHTSVCRLAKSVDQVCLVIKDGTFKKCMDNHPKVEVFESLSDVFQLQSIANHISNENLKSYFEGRDFSKLLCRYLVTQKELISDIYVPDGNVSKTDIIGVDVYNAEVNFPSSDCIRDVHITNFYSISKEEFTAEISFVTFAPVHFISDYGNYLELERDNSRDVDMDSMNGEGICDLYETHQAKFSGSIEFSLSEDLNVEQIISLTKNLCGGDSRISVSLNIETAELLDGMA
ncbi:PIN domain-containing protein [Vreelandella zhaodongensis]|uniref:PIN domain-containing protein n=1 Tax=Vreelandella zhaodongensis TaxID=1176240 RepID=UPI003EC07F4A